jgi:selenocysteine-specific elongation factor
MTIDLGFAWLRLPHGEEVGIIDVPGHRDFIENMLAGVGGIDAALVVVAADEGVMPQSKEHLAILDLLSVDRGVVALTKSDLVDDEWLELAAEEIRQLIEPTALHGSPIVPVSSTSGNGLSALLTALEDVLKGTPDRVDKGRPRLSVDRVFTMSGFGTIVTGTLLDGEFGVGDDIEILPSGRRGRIRGLQTHKTRSERSVPGTRVAMNISGLVVADIQRGDVVIRPDTYTTTALLDVHFSLLPAADRPLRHNQEVKFFLGAAQRIGRARVMGRERLNPGEAGWLQIMLKHPVVAERGDRYILRRPSPGATLGGGVVVDPHPIRRHRRNSPAVLARLESLLGGSPEDVLEETLQSMGPSSARAVLDASGLEAASGHEALQSLLTSGRAVMLAEGKADAASETFIASRAGLGQIEQRIREHLSVFHRDRPLRLGMPREELKSRLRIDARLFSRLMAYFSRAGWLVEDAARLRLADYQVHLSDGQRRDIEQLIRIWSQTPFSPPGLAEARQRLGEDLSGYLIEIGELVPVSEDVAFTRGAYEEMKAEVARILQQHGTITVAEARDRFSTSRKYILALLEHFDALGMTVREGDARRLARRNVENWPQEN